MFEDNENNFPAKPELTLSSARRRMPAFVLLIGFIALVYTSFFSNNLVFLGTLVSVIVLHELGHLLMMKILNTKSQGLFFMSLFQGITQNFEQSTNQRQQILINFMGPLPGLILGSILIYSLSPDIPNALILNFAFILIIVNWINLLPLDPLDGGRIIQNLFLLKSEKHFYYLALFSSLVFISIGVYFYLIPLILFGFLMSLKVRGFQKNNELHNDLDNESIDFRKDYEDLSNREYWKIRAAFLIRNPKIKEMIPSEFSLWENERLLVEQVRQILKIEVKQNLSLFEKIAWLLLLLVMLIIPLQILMENEQLFDLFLSADEFN